MSKLKLSQTRRTAVMSHLQAFFAKDLDQRLSDFQAGEIVDMMVETLGPVVYNEAVQDVRAHMQSKLDDLDGEVFADGPV